MASVAPWRRESTARTDTKIQSCTTETSHVCTCNDGVNICGGRAEVTDNTVPHSLHARCTPEKSTTRTTDVCVDRALTREPEKPYFASAPRLDPVEPSASRSSAARDEYARILARERHSQRTVSSVDLRRDRIFGTKRTEVFECNVFASARGRTVCIYICARVEYGTNGSFRDLREGSNFRYGVNRILEKRVHRVRECTETNRVRTCLRASGIRDSRSISRSMEGSNLRHGVNRILGKRVHAALTVPVRYHVLRFYRAIGWISRDSLHFVGLHGSKSVSFEIDFSPLLNL
ncbi:uncharacterized protein LOC143144533 [Ptiloglossa arizonensis]|uniref:uncharacterized protein LOC143144533 n=1 Tax=Ptiloglossa arizonensis TaxID=3350558 RepID=UPI003FA0409B